jgi:hypothetical protein
MNRTLQRATAVGLTVCLLLLSGLIYPQTVAHATHHAHHKAATHATALCSWMCAAGQVLEGVSFGLHADTGPVFLIGVPVSHEPSSAVLPSCSTRGPPVFSTN